MNPISLYVVTNRTNGKQYVGYTTTAPERRWHAHKTAARSGSMLCFHQALRKHGFEAFDWHVESTHSTLVEAKQAEIATIARLKPRYNMTAGGDGSGPWSEEQRRKMVEALTGKPKSPEHVAKVAAAQRGKVISPESRARMSQAQTGKKQSAETIAKRVESLRGHPVSEETRARIGAAHKGNTHALGVKHSPEAIIRMQRAAIIREATKRGELQLWR